MERAIDRDDVADGDHVLDAVVPGDAELPLDLGREPVAVEIMQMHVERLQAAQHRAADPPRGDGADVHALDVVGARDAIGDVPAALAHPIVRREVIAHEAEDHHHDMLGDADRVAVGHFGDGDAAVDRGLQIDMVGADPGGQRELEILRLGDAFGGQIGRPEGLRDDHVGIDQLALELAVGAVLVGCDDERVARAFEIFAKPQLARHAAEQFAGREVDRLGRREGGSVRDSDRASADVSRG